MKCPICGKKFYPQYPHLWVYKRGYGINERYMCSWKCLRQFDGVEPETKTNIDEGDRSMKEARKNREDVAEKIVAAIERGENPMDVVSKFYDNPAQAYWDIKKTMKTKRPDLYAKMNLYKGKRGRKTNNDLFVDKGMPKKDKPLKSLPIVKVDGPIVIETPETGAVKVVKDVKELDEVTRPPITGPVNFGGFEVTAIADKDLGEFAYDHKHDCIDWRTLAGDEVSLGPAFWRMLAERLPSIMGVLGVQV